MNLILILAAVIPAVLLLIQVYRADRVEKEPIPLLLGLLLCGVIAAELASLMEQAGLWLLERIGQGSVGFGALARGEALASARLQAMSAGGIYSVVLFFVVVAVSEEGFKYLLLRLRTWRSPDFNCSFDGVVYAVFLALGFALWENIQYVMRFGFVTALARAVTAVPGHACFGVFMGTWYGAAKRWELRENRRRSLLDRWMAVLVPVLLHGSYDWIATAQAANLGYVFLVFIAALFTASFLMVKHLSRNDAYIT